MTPFQRSRERGAVLVTVLLLMMLLLGFMGVALDFGRMFVVKGELQTALDSCALAAAQELDGQPDALTRASTAGIVTGNMNRVNFQSPSWNGQALTGTSITYRDSDYVSTTTPAAARYAQCASTQSSPTLLLPALGQFTGTPSHGPTTLNVGSFAVATRGSTQTSCPLPLALRPRAGGSAPHYGFSRGEWVVLLMGQNAAASGQIGWANLDGSNSASQTEAELAGRCGARVGDRLGTPGVQSSVADVWNVRFGIYKNSDSPAALRPDLTGYAYTAQNWPSRANAYDGAPGAGAHPTAQNFVTKRQSSASCADTGTTVRGANGCEGITGLSLNGFQRLAAPGSASGGHRQYGFSRRLVLVPVVNGASRVVDFACMLMLQPLTIPMSQVNLEFRGNASEPGSPCSTFGIPGGTGGPLVPVLVR